MVCLPRALPPTAGPGRYVRLTLTRGPGPDFSERDRAVLTLLGPHLDRAYLDAQRRRHPVPRLTPRQTRPAAAAGGRAHQHPDRPAAGHLRGDRAHPPGEHLRQAGRLQPHRRRHPRLPRPGRLALTGPARNGVSWSAPSFLAGPVSPANGRRSRLGETDRMRCSHGNLDAVAASGTPNPGKVATPGTPAVCAVNEPADQWRQSAWPGIRWTGFPNAKPAAAAGIQVRLSSATHRGGNASRRGRNRSATAAQVLQDGTARSHQKEPANVVSTRGWQNSQLCTAAAAAY